MIAKPTHVSAGQVRTDYVSYLNSAGLRLSACLDHTGRLQEKPWVVVAPKYGETKKNNLQLAYYLAANGLNVIRFDQSNHIGESEGRMQDFTLPGAVGDIIGTLDYLERHHGVTRSVLVSNSLSARCAFRAAATDSRISKLISVAGVVNMQGTLAEVYREDIFGTYLAGRHWGLTDILGFDINGEIFLGTAVDAGLHSLAGTGEDIARLKVPLIYFFGTDDAWIKYDDVVRTLAGHPLCQLIPVEGAMHEVRENPRAADDVFRRIVWACGHEEDYPGETESALKSPDKKGLIAQNRQEREKMQEAEGPAETENEFWSGYLEKYSVLEKSDDYRSYMELLGRLCIFRPGAIVLDAGCGNGIFGLWVVREAFLQRRTSFARNLPAFYVGLDLTRRGLEDAMDNHERALGRTDNGAFVGPPGAGYARFDFNELGQGAGSPRLPFADHTFDVICCSLLLSYLTQPQALLLELARVARPGAVVVLSSMKPHCDMSVIYRNFIDQQVTKTEMESARDLLRAAGKIRVKEEVGHYAFFSEAELSALAAGAGFKVQETFQSLGRQAIVIKTQK